MHSRTDRTFVFSMISTRGCLFFTNPCGRGRHPSHPKSHVLDAQTLAGVCQRAAMETNLNDKGIHKANSMYSESLSKTLESLGAVEGTKLSVVRDGRTYVGTLMPHHEFSAPDILILKMKSGYNVGVRITDATEISVVDSSERAGPSHPTSTTGRGRSTPRSPPPTWSTLCQRSGRSPT